MPAQLTTADPALAESGSTNHKLAAAQIWGTILGGGIAWFVQLIVLYVLAEFGCVGGWQRYTWLGLGVVHWGIALATLFALVAVAGCAWLAYRKPWRHPMEVVSDAQVAGREELVANESSSLWRFALFSNALFALIIVAQSIPAFFLIC